MSRAGVICWAILFVATLCLASGCDFGPLDDASTRGARVNGNQYFEATNAYPMYRIVVHGIRRYDPGQDPLYFQRALELALPVFRNDEGNPRKEGIEYLVVIIFELDGQSATFEERHCSARVFRRKDVIQADGHFDRLIQATPPEPRPLSSSVTPGVTSGWPIVVRHAAAHGLGPPATREAGIQVPSENAMCELGSVIDGGIPHSLEQLLHHGKRGTR